MPLGQAEAARSLGFTFGQNLRMVMLPQAFHTVVIPLGSVLIALTKNANRLGHRCRRGGVVDEGNDREHRGAGHHRGDLRVGLRDLDVAAGCVRLAGKTIGGCQVMSARAKNRGNR